ncbi:hypothetical protein BJ875DRAFT_545538 [Amylocarpus encephaloides]|uniref:Major facilitator superfamily (MFS) profile domain-containing protein n=1 Tax=Amylocarpus encephaloides TaxID=45428 RepID=A0A9P7YDK1_9HELO|nr:hypothetical protein BJ875DRAFT_545538 [Amylocarpus encephaloides]
MGVGNTALDFVGTCLSWPLMTYIGRRTIYLTGMAFMTTFLFIIAFLDFGRSHSGVVWAQASLMDVWTFTYQSTVGPICFVLISEAFDCIIFTVAMPYMLGSGQGNWRGKAGFLFGAISAAYSAWRWMRIPETKGRTFEELDILFEKKVPSGQFKKYDLIHAGEGA